eukprot:CAMPEP_0196573886 /NCGR_PEP_ID=MMETSP1081-20130531/3705_1 /TAXON_ID=36882 /ORGANISM="Pyramimonas amylifera, Strain CCMP720" /LENGTH=454 /DNA_ID=CAMNT_0041891733 /DNA_START=28 /DNA_END=1392 /DNA_ORIENTATION=-
MICCFIAGFGRTPGSDQSAAGYIKLDNSRDAHLFYWFFNSKGSVKDPLVLWLSGGPGCSSQFALLEENGPYKLAPNITLIRAKYSWSEYSNLLFVDQPVNSGYSYTHSSNDTVHNEQEVAEDMYAFMQEFYTRFPAMRDLEFFITGESYAGHYIPAISHRIVQGNTAAAAQATEQPTRETSQHINLRGMAIGNGNTDPEVQYPAFTDFAFDNKLISLEFKEALDKNYTLCGALIAECKNSKTGCGRAHQECHRSTLIPLEDEIGRRNFNGGKMNQYDIRLPCCYDFSQDDLYFDQAAVKEALGVPAGLKWRSCSDEVQGAFLQDWMLDVELVVPSILRAGVRVLIYAGDQDFVCNWLGNQRWTRQMMWPGHAAFNSAPVRPWTAAGGLEPAGEFQTAKGLTFIKVFRSGHMVPRDQPEAAFDMIRRFIQNEDFGSNGGFSSRALNRLPRKVVNS